MGETVPQAYAATQPSGVPAGDGAGQLPILGNVVHF
jgi:hypothetical protein